MIIKYLQLFYFIYSNLFLFVFNKIFRNRQIWFVCLINIIIINEWERERERERETLE